MPLFFRLFCLSLLLISCHKKEEPKVDVEPENISLNDGLGKSSESIHGHVFASLVKSRYYSYSNYYYSLTVNAAFADPARNLLGSFNRIDWNRLFNTTTQANVSVGGIYVCNLALGSKNTTNYSGSINTASDLSYTSCDLITEGNGSFLPLNLSISRGFPKFKKEILTDTLYKNKDFVLDKTDLFENYDSLIIRIPISSGSFTKRFSSSDQVIIKKENLASLDVYSSNISIVLYNFSNTTVAKKKYIFELSNRLIKDIVVTN